MKKNIVIIVLSVVALLLAGTVGYLIVEKETNDNLDKGSIIETKDYDLGKAEEILEYFGFNDNLGGSKIYNHIYNDTFKKIKALEKVDSSKIKMVNCSDLYNEEYGTSYYKGEYGVCKKDAQVESISYEIVNEIHKQMYGVDMKKEGLATPNQESGIFGVLYYNFYDYNEELNSFVKLEGLGLGGATGPYYNVNKIKSAKTIGNELIIEVYYLSGYPNYNNYTNEYTYNLVTSKIAKTLDVNSIEEFETTVLNNYLDKLDVYEVVFELKDNDYVFKKLSKKLS